jgi:hypothetical protein
MRSDESAEAEMDDAGRNSPAIITWQSDPGAHLAERRS